MYRGTFIKDHDVRLGTVCCNHHLHAVTDNYRHQAFGDCDAHAFTNDHCCYSSDDSDICSGYGFAAYAATDVIDY